MLPSALPTDMTTFTIQVTPAMAEVWDRLMQFDAAKSDDALDYLLNELCQLVNGSAAHWIGALRVNAHDPNDPLLGWRPRISHRLDSKPCDNAFARQKMAEVDSAEPDDSIKAQVRMAGRFRAYLRADILAGTWQQLPRYLEKKSQYGVIDRLYIVTPLNEDMECYVTVDRLEGQANFSRQDCEKAAALLRGLAWFHRQVALSYGLHIGTAAITPTERRVLQQLLTDLSEREIAAELDLAYSTVHSYVTTLYRKFDVKGRAGLTALWLGQGMTVC